MKIRLANKIKREIRRFLELEEFYYLSSSVIELNNIGELRKVFGWEKHPDINDPKIYEFRHIEDVNERRVREAEILATLMCNIKPKIVIEIGTGKGHSTALMAQNSPESNIYTVNIPPEEIIAGKGGKLTTKAFNKDEIGSYYKEKKLTNITQIYANTLTWQPDIGLIDISFIDGCHDTDYVYNDTLKILRNSKPGSFILWHDFNLNLTKKYYWIHHVCKGVEKLFAKGYLKGKILHVKDSWIGIYRIPGEGK